MAAMAKPKPVLPDVGSTMVYPGSIRPCFSAASIIWMPMRSFMLPPGLRNSSLAKIVHGMPSVNLFSLSTGVFPIRSRMLVVTFLMLFWAGFLCVFVWWVLIDLFWFLCGMFISPILYNAVIPSYNTVIFKRSFSVPQKLP